MRPCPIPNNGVELLLPLLCLLRVQVDGGVDVAHEVVAFKVARVRQRLGYAAPRRKSKRTLGATAAKAKHAWLEV